jgi:hypothetical protein
LRGFSSTSSSIVAIQVDVVVDCEPIDCQSFRHIGDPPMDWTRPARSGRWECVDVDEGLRKADLGLEEVSRRLGTRPGGTDAIRHSHRGAARDDRRGSAAGPTRLNSIRDHVRLSAGRPRQTSTRIRQYHPVRLISGPPAILLLWSP